MRFAPRGSGYGPRRRDPTEKVDSAFGSRTGGEAGEALEPHLVPLEETPSQVATHDGGKEARLRLFGDDEAPPVSRLDDPAVVRRRPHTAAAPREAPARDELRDGRV